jgi:hypothetical protein
MLNKLVSHGDLRNDECLQFAVSLWNMSLKSNSMTKLHVSFLKFFDKFGRSP